MTRADLASVPLLFVQLLMLMFATFTSWLATCRAISHSSPRLMSEEKACRFWSSTFTSMSPASGAIPRWVPERLPLPRAIPATSVPWPLSSSGFIGTQGLLGGTQFTPATNLDPGRLSCTPSSTPESTTAMLMPRPLIEGYVSSTVMGE